MFICYDFPNSFQSGDTHIVLVSVPVSCQSFPGHWLLLTAVYLTLLSTKALLTPSPQSLVGTTLGTQTDRFSGHLDPL